MNSEPQVPDSIIDAQVLRLVEIEPWSRLPERRWALGPYEA